MIINFKTYNWYRDYLIKNIKQRYIAITAGLGAGKTYAAMQAFLLRCFINNKSEFSAIMMPSYQKFKDTIIPKFREVAASIKMFEDIHYRILKGSYPKIEFLFFPHEIHLITASNPKTISAVEYSHGWIDEAGDIDEVAVSRFLERIRCNKAKVRQVIFTGVPQGLNWFADMFDSEDEEQIDLWKEIKFKENDYIKIWKQKNKLRIKADTRSNSKFLPNDYIDDLVERYSFDKSKLDSYIEGRFTDLHSGVAVNKFNRKKHLTEIEIDKHRAIILSFDFNNLPLAWVVIQIQVREEDNERKKFYCVVEESDNLNQVLDDACMDFLKKFAPKKFKNTPIFIFGDRTGHAKSHKTRVSDFNYIRDFLKQFYKNVEIRASKRVAPEGDSIDVVNRLFFKGLLFVNKNCNNTIRSIIKTKWKQGVRKLDKPAGEQISHWLDALKYPLYQLEVLDSLESQKYKRGLVV